MKSNNSPLKWCIWCIRLNRLAVPESHNHILTVFFFNAACEIGCIWEGSFSLFSPLGTDSNERLIQGSCFTPVRSVACTRFQKARRKLYWDFKSDSVMSNNNNNNKKELNLLSFLNEWWQLVSETLIRGLCWCKARSGAQKGLNLAARPGTFLWWGNSVKLQLPALSSAPQLESLKAPAVNQVPVGWGGSCLCSTFFCFMTCDSVWSEQTSQPVLGFSITLLLV